jgi:hypothetical protein
MDHVILFRSPSGKVDFIADIDGDIMVFPDLDAAVAFTGEHHMFMPGGVDYQIVELDEL